jgi:hypothetical protein
MELKSQTNNLVDLDQIVLPEEKMSVSDNETIKMKLCEIQKETRDRFLELKRRIKVLHSERKRLIAIAEELHEKMGKQEDFEPYNEPAVNHINKELQQTYEENSFLEDRLDSIAPFVITAHTNRPNPRVLRILESDIF